jgi:hypothetical protein
LLSIFGAAERDRAFAGNNFGSRSPVEDEGFVDDEFIEEVAREYVARYGPSGVAMLQERARIAEATGDYLLAQSWRQIAEAADQLTDFY